MKAKSRTYNSISVYVKDMIFAYLLIIEGMIFNYCITTQKWILTGLMIHAVVVTLRYFRKYIRKIRK